MKLHKTADGQVVFDGRDFAALNAALNQAHKSLELLGKATALFENQPAPVQQNTIVVVMQAAPAMADEADAVTIDVT